MRKPDFQLQLDLPELRLMVETYTASKFDSHMVTLFGS